MDSPSGQNLMDSTSKDNVSIIDTTKNDYANIEKTTKIIKTSHSTWNPLTSPTIMQYFPSAPALPTFPTIPTTSGYLEKIGN